MKLAIHHSYGSYSDRWIRYCDDKQITYKIVDCYRSDIIEQIDECDALMWHFHHANAKDTLFARQLIFSVYQSGKSVFPDFNTSWHFDDKVGQKYLLESLKIPHADYWTFFDREPAIRWAQYAIYPLVFKLRAGAGSVNVRKIETFDEAKKIIDRSFSKGFKHDSLLPFNELFTQYANNKISFFKLGKGTIRRLIPTRYSRIHGKEKGYVLFQKFISDNDHDIRVVVIGDKAFAIKRLVRDNDFRASGSGKILYNKELFDEATIKLSFEIASKLRTQCVALDYVHENGKPLVVEISYGFSPEGYDPCPGYWDKDLVWHEGKFNPYGWMIEDVIKRVQTSKGDKRG